MAVPEIPVESIQRAIGYYVKALGFHVDWEDKQSGIAGISQDDCRIFLANDQFRKYYGGGKQNIVWLNLNSKEEVDELYERWRAAGAILLDEPGDKPWHLREFRAADPDGNQLRVFYDFSWELPPAAA